MVYSRLFLFVLIASTIQSCTSTSDDFQLDFGREYYPVRVGSSWEYQIDSIIFTPTSQTKSYHSTTLIKEVIADTFIDNSGFTIFRIERFERTADSLPWTIKRVLSSSISNDRAIRTEDNLRFIKMAFPLRKNSTWNGNAHFNSNLIVNVASESLEMFKGWKSKIVAVGVADTIDSMKFPEITKIQLAEFENLIELRRGVEKYAKNIGLIYKELWVLDTQCIDKCTGQNWLAKAEKGFVVKQKIIKWN
jgi:hypothetical protein